VPPPLDGLELCGDGWADLRRERALARIALAQLGVLRRLETIRVAKGSGVVRGRFPVGAHDGRELGGARRELEDGRPVPRCVGMDDEPRPIGHRGTGAQDRECASVPRPTFRRRHRADDRLPGELVAEPEEVTLPLKHAPRNALLDCDGRPARDGPSDVRLRPVAEHGCGGKDISGRGGQAPRPSGDGVANGDRELPVAGRQALRHEERVAGRRAMERDRIDACAGRQRAHGIDRQRRHVDRGDGSRRQVAEGQAKRVDRSQLIVAVRPDEQDRQVVDPAPDHPQQVKRRLVRPVEVLEDDDRGRRPPPAQLGQEGIEDPGSVACGQCVPKASVRRLAQVRQRRERSCGQNRIG
jgi:hypothetical protein